MINFNITQALRILTLSQVKIQFIFIYERFTKKILNI